MVDFKGTTDLRDVITDFIYSQVNKRFDEEKRNDLTQVIYSLSEDTIKQLKREIEDNIRIFTTPSKDFKNELA